jgi:hypothetical protein
MALKCYIHYLPRWDWSAGLAAQLFWTTISRDYKVVAILVVEIERFVDQVSIISKG